MAIRPISNLLFSVAVCSSLGFCQQLGPNPVIPGDHPDPSIIRVDRTYWATNTSGDWAPLFPLFSSRNLRDWKQIGSVFNKMPEWASGDFWAPEIVSDRGHFRVYYAARKRGGPLCVAVAAASLAAGPYSDQGPIMCQQDGSIDPAFIRDERGHPYLVWKEDGNSIRQPTYLWAQSLNNAGTQLTGIPHRLLSNDAAWEGNVVEAPYLFWRHGWIYMFYAGGACCGHECNYGVGVARAHHLLGPWQKDPDNPIVIGNDKWRCPGHGSAVDDGRGRQYFMYHAYSARGDVFVGRESVIDRVNWDAAAWPTINRNRGVGIRSGAGTSYRRFWNFRDKPDMRSWQWAVTDKPVIELLPTGLLVTSSAPTNDTLFNAFLGQETRSLQYTAETVLNLEPHQRAAAGLAVVGDSKNAVGIAVLDGKITAWSRRNGKDEVLATVSLLTQEPVHLRISVDKGYLFALSESADGKEWKSVGGTFNANSMAPWDLGLRVGLTFRSDDQAAFSSFNLSGVD